VGQATKAERRGGVTDQPSKAGQVVNPRTDLWDRGQHLKLNWPTLLLEELTKKKKKKKKKTELQVKGNTAATW
jgi:hypothetical protein